MGGKPLQIYGTKIVPFSFGTKRIEIKVVICDVTTPLISTNDLISKGISLHLDSKLPCIEANNMKFKIINQGKHFWIKQRYKFESEGITAAVENIKKQIVSSEEHT